MMNKRLIKVMMVVLSVSVASAAFAAPSKGKANSGKVSIHKFWPSS